MLSFFSILEEKIGLKLPLNVSPDFVVFQIWNEIYG